MTADPIPYLTTRPRVTLRGWLYPIPLPEGPIMTQPTPTDPATRREQVRTLAEVGDAAAAAYLGRPAHVERHLSRLSTGQLDHARRALLDAAAVAQRLIVDRQAAAALAVTPDQDGDNPR